MSHGAPAPPVHDISLFLESIAAAHRTLQGQNLALRQEVQSLRARLEGHGSVGLDAPSPPSTESTNVPGRRRHGDERSHRSTPEAEPPTPHSNENAIRPRPRPSSLDAILPKSPTAAPASTRTSTGLSPEAKSEARPEKPWYVGRWVDKSGRFFAGSVITIEAEKWNPRSSVSQYGEASLRYVLQNSLDCGVLVEKRPDGTERRYRLTQGIAGCATVSLEESPLTWFLTKADKKEKGFVANTLLRNVMEERDNDGASLDRFLSSCKFECFMLAVICVNMGLAAIRSDMSVKGYDDKRLEIIEFVFVGVYALEIMLVVIARGHKAFFRAYFIFDCLLVALGIGHVLTHALATNMASDAPLHQTIAVFRSFRVLRVLRAFRAVPFLGTAWRLVIGLYHATGLMVSTVALLAIMLFIFAFIGLHVITKQHFEDEQALQVIQDNFSTLLDTMVSLMQFVTLDSISSLYKPLVHEKPFLALYFVPLVFVVSITLMNLVMAVVVDGALTFSQADRDERKMQLMTKVHDNVPLFENLFCHLDVDRDGIISRAEIDHVNIADLPEHFHEIFRQIKLNNIVDMWEMLDVSNTGYVSQREFVDGLLNVVVADQKEVPTEIILMLSFMRKARERSQCMEVILHDIRSEQINLVKRGAFSAPDASHSHICSV